MADQWYYEHEFEALGPFSGKQLADLAATGVLLPTDTVWKEGVERGVMAGNVRNLFPPGSATLPEALASSGAEAGPLPAPADVETTAATDPPAAVETKPVPVAAPPTPNKWEGTYQPPTGRSRAVAGKGVLIVGQDGVTVKYRLKCQKCNHEDSSWKTMNIPRGTARVGFYCTKCRKQRLFEIHGQSS